MILDLKDLPDSPDGYDAVLELLRKCTTRERQEHMRLLALDDLYFLLRFILQRDDSYDPPSPRNDQGELLRLGESDGQHKKEMEARVIRHRQWVFDRCREVQKNPDGYLDLWARAHYKSTIITFAKTLQDILNNPDIRIGIFSQDNQTAEEHLKVIKRELENNNVLKELFPDILYMRPESESPQWSQQKGLIVKRKSNPKEPTLSSYGLVDGLPAGPHFDLLIFDDTVTKESVRTPEQIKKTTEAWEHAQGLKAAGARCRYIGTRYHLADTYQEIIKRRVAIKRIYASEDAEGNPRMLASAELADIRRTMGPTTYASQMMQDPRADTAMGFSRLWVEKTKYAGRPEDIRKGLNVYVVVDPANAKKKTSDYTAGFVIGLGSDKNYYILDMERDRLNLSQRADLVFSWKKKWEPLAIGYEQYGVQADIDYMYERMGRENYRFNIIALGGQVKKEDRIRTLQPLFEQGRIWFPGKIEKVDMTGRARDLMADFIDEEYAAFPVGAHDDMLDALARINETNLGIKWPLAYVPSRPRRQAAAGWMAR